MPYDCGSSPGDCFFASLGHALYKNADCHLQIRSAGITHLMHNPELYIESLANISWENYIEEMSKPGTWCDNIIIQAVANALGCTIHITDSSPNANATIVSPITLHKRQKIVFLGYLTDIHYVSTLPNESVGNQTDSKRKEMLEKKRVYAKKYRSNESVNAKRIRLDKVAEHKKSKKASESSQSVNQSKYLNEFDSMKNGPLHGQCWAKCNMKQFHKSVQYCIFQCTVCKEAWPITSKPKCPGSYLCSHCSRDKNMPKKFSDAKQHDSRTGTC